MELFYALYFLGCTSPFKRLIRISNETLNNTSIINLLQTNLKRIKKNIHVIFLLKLHRFIYLFILQKVCLLGISNYLFLGYGCLF